MLCVLDKQKITMQRIIISLKSFFPLKTRSLIRPPKCNSIYVGKSITKKLLKNLNKLKHPADKIQAMLTQIKFHQQIKQQSVLTQIKPLAAAKQSITKSSILKHDSRLNLSSTRKILFQFAAANDINEQQKKQKKLHKRNQC